MFFDYLFQDVPHHGRAGFDFLLGGLDGRGDAHGFETREDERLEQLKRHQLRQTALMELERGTHHDHGATRVIDPLAQQVLAETSALAFDHVGQGLERALVGARHRLAATTVVQQRIHGLLQHALFIASNDFRCFQFQQTAQTAVAVDHATVQIVQIRGGKTATVQRHQGAQIRWQHGQHVEYHPLGLDAGFLERFKQLEALGVFLDLQLGTGRVVAKLLDRAVDVNALQQILDAFGTHLGLKLVAVFLEFGVKIVFRHDAEFLQRRHARIGHHISFKVQHAFDVAQGHVEHQAQTRRQ